MVTIGALPVRNMQGRTYSAFLIAFYGLIWLNYWADINTYPYDSGTYCALAEPSTLFNFPDIFRGYVLALLLMPSHALVDYFHGLFPFRIASAAAYSYLLVGPVADFFFRILALAPTILRRLAFPAFIALIYPGLLLYPLSDLAAAIAIICATFLLMRHTTLSTIGAGSLAYAAYNIRPIYLVSALVLGCLLPTYITNKRTFRERSLRLVPFLVGAFIVAMPQMSINWRHGHGVTPRVITDLTTTSLRNAQLFLDVVTQKYETSIAPEVPLGSVFYRD